MAEFLQAAARYEQLGLIDDAIAAYGQVADAGLGGAEPLMRKGLLHSQKGDVKAALRDFERAAAAEPRNPYPHMRWGHLTAGMGRAIGTVQHMRAAVQIAPEIVEMQVNLAAAYSRATWLDLAYRIAVALPLDLGDWWAGIRQVAIADYRTARAAALTALRGRRPQEDHHGKLFDLAQLLYRVGRLRTARRLCERIIGENPGWFLPFWLCSEIIGRQSGPDDALACVRSYRMPDHPEAYVTADVLEAEAGLLNELGRYEELWARLEAQPHVERRSAVRYVAVIAAFMTDRDADLTRLCLKWMEEAPLSAVPAGFIVLLHVRATAVAEPRPTPVEPRPAGVHVAQFWNTPAPPADVLATMESWTRLNPTWRRTLFDEDSARAFLSSRFGSEAVEAFSHCYHAAMMADFFRIAFLHECGGLYVDADEGCVRPVDAILPDLGRYEVVAPRADGVPGFVDTPFLGARQGSRIMRLVLEDMIKNIRLDVEAGRRPAIWEVTGPGALTRGVAHYLGREDRDPDDDVFLLPFQQFRAHVQTRDLLYKRDVKMNWRMATAD